MEDQAMETLETISDVLKDQPEPEEKLETVWEVIQKTPWGEKGIWVLREPAEKVEETEEQKTAREAFQKVQEEALAKDKALVDDWWEMCVDVDEEGRYKHPAQFVADACNLTSLIDMPMFGRKGKKMTAMDVIKLRTRYGLPASACHNKGKKFVLGTGRKRQEYVVGKDGEWRKVG